MKRVRPAVLLALVSVLAAAAADGAETRGPIVPEDGAAVLGANAVAGRGCATPEPTVEQSERARVAVERYLDELGARPLGGEIKVAWHVIHDGRTGNLPQSQIEAQIEVLNRDFIGTGYTFVLASVDRTERKNWFGMMPGTGKETHAKRALAIDPARRLNLYSCEPGQGVLGWAYLPQSIPESNELHGVVIHYGTVPGGPLAPYDLGRTATHEVGHYLGLYHTFQGACEAPGDEVDDTPFEASPAFGCPVGRNTCPLPGDDPIRNYMDYTDDACMNHFTAGQDARMDAIVPVYRPSLLDAGRAQASIARPEIDPLASLPAGPTRGVHFRGAGPNPFRRETALRFTLPESERVELRLYDIAGKLVQTLVDGVLPAGEHGVMVRADGLNSGMYFARLRVRGEELSRSVVLIR